MEAINDDGADAMSLSVHVRPSYGGGVGLGRGSGAKDGDDTEAMGLSVCRSVHPLVLLIYGSYEGFNPLC